jgi:DNA-binding transcriptional LysR family regulator
MSRATVAKETRLNQLTSIPLSPRLTRHLAVVYPKERFHSRLVNGFVQFAKQRLGAQAPQTVA